MLPHRKKTVLCDKAGCWSWHFTGSQPFVCHCCCPGSYSVLLSSLHPNLLHQHMAQPWEEDVGSLGWRMLAVWVEGCWAPVWEERDLRGGREGGPGGAPLVTPDWPASLPFQSFTPFPPPLPPYTFFAILYILTFHTYVSSVWSFSIHLPISTIIQNWSIFFIICWVYWTNFMSSVLNFTSQREHFLISCFFLTLSTSPLKKLNKTHFVEFFFLCWVNFLMWLDNSHQRKSFLFFKIGNLAKAFQLWLP